MDIKEFYLSLSYNFDGIYSRLPSLSLIYKFVLKFLDDDSFINLEKGIDTKDRDLSFRSVHTLKGVAANLEFNTLISYCHELTEYIRNENALIDDKAVQLFSNIKDEYLRIIVQINKLKESSN